MELTKEYFDSQLKTLNNRMDGFPTKADLGSLATKQDLESLATRDDLRTLKTDLDEIKVQLQKLSKRDLEDSDAFAKDILDLKKRVATGAATKTRCINT
jgi:hypothetical protein